MSDDPQAVFEELDGHARRNAELRKKLEAEGVRLDEKRPVEVFFFATSHRDAAILARDLYKAGFLVMFLAPSISAGDDDEKWSVKVGANMVPEYALGAEFTERMVNLAAAHHATYDGWGMSV